MQRNSTLDHSQRTSLWPELSRGHPSLPGASTVTTIFFGSMAAIEKESNCIQFWNLESSGALAVISLSIATVTIYIVTSIEFSSTYPFKSSLR